GGDRCPRLEEAGTHANARGLLGARPERGETRPRSVDTTGLGIQSREQGLALELERALLAGATLGEYRGGQARGALAVSGLALELGAQQVDVLRVVGLTVGAQQTAALLELPAGRRRVAGPRPQPAARRRRP